MKNFIEVKSIANNRYIISISNIAVIRERRVFPTEEVEILPGLADLSVCTVIYNLCGEPLCYTTETIENIVNKIEKAQP